MWLPLALTACHPGPPPTELIERPPPPSRIATRPEPPPWPEAGAPLHLLAPRAPADWHPRRIVLDPGHGAPPDNLGNTGATCLREADEMLRLSRAILPSLHRPELFEVRTSRPDEHLVDYGTRITEADAWPADALVSLHSDMRSWETGTPDPETGCNRADGAAGFAVLWSDEGPAPLAEARHRLAKALAARLVEAGFLAYDGTHYQDLYEGDEQQPGVFVDRHQPDQRIRMLRRPTIPSVIVETHEALDRREVARWSEPQTAAAFASALRQGLIDALGPR